MWYILTCIISPHLPKLLRKKKNHYIFAHTCFSQKSRLSERHLFVHNIKLLHRRQMKSSQGLNRAITVTVIDGKYQAVRYKHYQQFRRIEGISPGWLCRTLEVLLYVETICSVTQQAEKVNLSSRCHLHKSHLVVTRTDWPIVESLCHWQPYLITRSVTNPCCNFLL